MGVGVHLSMPVVEIDARDRAEALSCALIKPCVCMYVYIDVYMCA